MKTIQHFVIAILAMIWGVIFVSCSDDEKNGPEPSSQPPIEDFDQGNMNFTASASARSLTFKANTTWSVSVAETSSGVAWCRVSPAAGEAGEQDVTVYVDANYALDERSVTLTLKAGSEKKTFVVTQKPMGALLLTSDKYEVDPQGGTITVEVKANVDYTATVSEACKDWIKEVADTKGLTTTTKSYQISANKNEKKREGMIFFSDGELRDTVHVYQAVGDVILLTRNEYYADAAGEEITVELRSNCEYEVVMPSVDWIHEITTRAMSSHTLRYTVDANPDYDSREAIIVYKDLNGSTSDTLTIIQAPKNVLVLGEKEYMTGPEGGTIEVKVASNVEYDIAIENSAKSWISEVGNSDTKALVENMHYFKIAKTDKTYNRKGTIKFSTKGGVCEEIIVTQEGALLKIISDEQIEIGEENQTFEVILNANVDFDVLPQVEWIEFVEKKQEDEKITVILSVSENSESNQRTADIIFSNEAYNMKEKLLVIQQAKTQIITVKLAGTLSSLINNYEEIESLKIKGPLNGTDIKFLRGMLGYDSKLAYLDLSEAFIIEGGDYYYYFNGGYATSNNVVGEKMFEKAKLKILILPQNVTCIETYAFKGSRIEKLTMPDGIIKVMGHAFAESEISDINISDLTAWCNSDFIDYPFEYAEREFLNNELLTDLVIPDEVTSICRGAFSSCNSLIKVYIPKSVSQIDLNSFRYCRNLKEVTIENGVKEIGNNAFLHCEKLERIAVPNSVTVIGEGTFSGCKSLTGFIIPNNLTKIESGMFAGTGISHIEIPSHVTEIGGSAFSNCENLAEIHIPSSVNEIKYSTFSYCTSLENITIGNVVTKIGPEAFYNVPLKNFYIYTVTPPVIDDTSFKSTNYVESTLYVPKGCVQAYTDAGWGYYFYNIVEMDE